jgi:hypothetical protein
MKPATWVVVCDTHVAPEGSVEGGVDEAASSVLMQAVRLVRPDGFLHLGDVGEWESVCDYRWERRRRPPFEFLEPMVRRDGVAVNGWLDGLERELDRVGCGRRVMTEGNHEVWLDNFAELETRPEFAARRVLRMKERGWEWHEHGQFARIGKLWDTSPGCTTRTRRCWG